MIADLIVLAIGCIFVCGITWLMLAEKTKRKIERYLIGLFISDPDE